MKSTTDVIVLTGRELKEILERLCPDVTDAQLDDDICIRRVVTVMPEHGDHDVELFAECASDPESKFLVAP